MLKKINRISGRKEFLEVKNKGRLFGGFLFGSLGLNVGDDKVKFGFIISKKISKRAVDRNKIKRKMSEVLKGRINEFELGTRVIFLAKKNLLEAKIEEIDGEINKVFQFVRSSANQKKQNPPPVKPESSLDEGRKF